MTPRTFIHFASHSAIVIDLATLSPSAADCMGLECRSATPWSETLGPWLATRGIELSDLLPSETASNTPRAPTWASVPDELLSELRDGIGDLHLVRVERVAAARSSYGEYWLQGARTRVRVPRCLLADVGIAGIGIAA